MSKSKVVPLDLTLNIDNDICSICIDKLDYNKKIKIKTLDCNHKFHSSCIIPWININNNCPLCRKEIETTIPNTPNTPTTPITNTHRRQYIYHHNEEQEIIRPLPRQRNKTKCSLLMLFCLVVCVSVNLIYFHNLSITYIEHINIQNKNNTNITTPQPNLNNLTNNSTNQNHNQSSTNIYNYSSITFLILYFSFYGICQLFCIYKYYSFNKEIPIALFISSSILMLLIPLYYIFDIINTLEKIDNNESKPNLDTQINMNYKTSTVMFYFVLLIYIIQYLYISSR
jgi:hypothetical protein